MKGESAVGASLICQLHQIWNELHSRTCGLELEAEGQHAFDLDLEAGRHKLLNQIGTCL